MKRLLVLTSIIFFLCLCTELWAQSNFVFVDFEDGLIHNAQGYSFPNRVNVLESGNHFLRLTANPTDCGPAFLTTCPRTRSLFAIGWSPITSGQTVTYSWRMRIPGAANNFGANQNGMVVQWFQDADGAFGGARPMWIGNFNGHLWLVDSEVNIANGQSQDCQTCGVDLGPIPYDKWTDYSLSVFLSSNPALGRMDLSINGVHAATITGTTTRSDSELTRWHFQIVDFTVPGPAILTTADYDNAQISSGKVD